MNNAKKILVVEDEEKIANVIRSFLEAKGYPVVWAQDGKRALDLFDRENFSMILLDLMLPLVSGEEVCRSVRRRSQIPIIMLTAKSDESDMLQGLGIGADDYITKPFSLKTLSARIEAVLRRAGDNINPLYQKKSFFDGDLTVDSESRLIMKQSKEVRLTPHEYSILIALMKHPTKVFTRDELIVAAFGDDFEGFDRTIDSHIKNLRQKIETDPKNSVYVKTVHGVGYRFGGE